MCILFYFFPYINPHSLCYCPFKTKIGIGVLTSSLQGQGILRFPLRNREQAHRALFHSHQAAKRVSWGRFSEPSQREAEAFFCVSTRSMGSCLAQISKKLQISQFKTVSERIPQYAAVPPRWSHWGWCCGFQCPVSPFSFPGTQQQLRTASPAPTPSGSSRPKRSRGTNATGGRLS